MILGLLRSLGQMWNSAVLLFNQTIHPIILYFGDVSTGVGKRLPQHNTDVVL